jgi:hypothetical protein
MPSWCCRCFGQGAEERGWARRVLIGRYYAFTVILVVAVGVAFGASFG